MKNFNCFLLVYIFITGTALSQGNSFSLNTGWKFREVGTQKWYAAEVPGTVHTDLLSNNIIPDPFYGDNESKVQWVEEKDWEYTTSFSVSQKLLTGKVLYLQFDGLDTYADVYLNNELIIRADNMFRQWTAEVQNHLKKGSNSLLVKFTSAAKKAKSLKASERIPHPDNERIYVRKAQYQFGWDWAPRLVTCGIWKDVRLVSSVIKKENLKPEQPKRTVRLVTQKDEWGEAFYFTVNEKRTFIKGANWVPADSFLPRAKKEKHYENLIKAAKDANINMLRVWGGGIYEDDIFYDLCDKYGIMVWQDFMFAGAMYPDDSLFIKNIESEVRYQVNRLKHHPSIVLWCGNNEIEEAWFNWGWQKQFNYSSNDSLRLWNNYKTIFHSIIPNILNEEDPERPYWPSSPSLGWGRDSAYKKGDVHYWGVWWGKEPVEKYKEKTGRFVSEYGMQGMPNMKTIQQFSTKKDWDTASIVMKAHQKHPFGWENVKYYIENKLRTPEGFENIAYVSQLMQADAIGIAIKAHRMNQPITMGTMFWQWNDCWPVTSWSAIDYFGRKKAMFYEVKRSFKDSVLLLDITADTLSAFLNLNNSDSERMDYDLKISYHSLSNKNKIIKRESQKIKAHQKQLFPLQFNPDDVLVQVDVFKNGKKLLSEQVLRNSPKTTNFPKANISYTFKNGQIKLSSDVLAYGVFIDVPDGVELEDNFFILRPKKSKAIKFSSTLSVKEIEKAIKVKSLADTY